MGVFSFGVSLGLPGPQGLLNDLPFSAPHSAHSPVSKRTQWWKLLEFLEPFLAPSSRKGREVRLGHLPAPTWDWDFSSSLQMSSVVTGKAFSPLLFIILFLDPPVREQMTTP